MTKTMVFLIGAGPGDPGLITMRGVECLRRADVVLHDHEVNPRLLQQARPGAELIDVGGAAPHVMAQEAICYLIAEKAREGKVVARLKWGDPFLFDRGGEEALFLQQNGVRLEIVPGVPMVLGAPAYAGIPITYPGGGDTLTILRGCDETGTSMPDVDWQALARLNGTLLCYASAYQLPRILDALASNGFPPDTPVAVIADGTLPTQVTAEGTLGGLFRDWQERPHRGPALLVVGRVVAFREYLRWFDRRPLFGRRVVVTRPREQAADLVERLTALGAQAIEAPMIRILSPDDARPLADAVAGATAFDWIVFTSGNAVDAFMHALFAGDRDARALSGPRLCAVGTATAEKLAAFRIKADLVPQEFTAEAAFEALRRHGPLDGLRVLLPHGDIGREVLADELRGAGASVTEVVAYRNVIDERQRDGDPDIYRMLLDGQIDAVTFTSASAVKNFATVYGAEQTADLLRHTTVAAIGPVTADAATKLGIDVSVQPGTYTVAALADAIAAHFVARAAKDAKTV